MSNVYGLMDVGVKALNAQQLTMQIAGHNISNVTIPGHSKQVTVMESTDPTCVGSMGQRGTGVKVTSMMNGINVDARKGRRCWS